MRSAVWLREAFKEEAKSGSNKAADLSSLTSMLAARWKSGTGGATEGESLRSGQIRSFRISKIDAAAKKIELELA